LYDFDLQNLGHNIIIYTITSEQLTYLVPYDDSYLETIK